MFFGQILNDDMIFDQKCNIGKQICNTFLVLILIPQSIKSENTRFKILIKKYLSK